MIQAAYTPPSFPLTFKLGIIHTPWLDWAEPTTAQQALRTQGLLQIEFTY